MKKKIMIFVTGLVMAGLFGACAENVDVPASEAPTTEEITAEAETEEETTEETTTEAATEENIAPDEASGDEFDSQNPFMNFIGVYHCDLANINVQSDGNDTAKVVVIWGDGYSSSSEWNMTIKWNDDMKFEYKDCVKKTSTYNEDAELESETVDYEDGTGSFEFNNNEIIWHDDKEYIADGMVFEYQLAPSAPDEAGE